MNINLKIIFLKNVHFKIKKIYLIDFEILYISDVCTFV